MGPVRVSAGASARTTGPRPGSRNGSPEPSGGMRKARFAGQLPCSVGIQISLLPVRPAHQSIRASEPHSPVSLWADPSPRTCPSRRSDHLNTHAIARPRRTALSPATPAEDPAHHFAQRDRLGVPCWPAVVALVTQLLLNMLGFDGHCYSIRHGRQSKCRFIIHWRRDSWTRRHSGLW
jgi:hypothetical protein